MLDLAQLTRFTPPILLTLQVKGRTTGRLHSNVLVPVTYKDQQYLVSILGDGSEWVLPNTARVAEFEAIAAHYPVFRIDPR